MTHSVSERENTLSPQHCLLFSICNKRCFREREREREREGREREGEREREKERERERERG